MIESLHKTQSQKTKCVCMRACVCVCVCVCVYQFKLTHPTAEYLDLCPHIFCDINNGS